MDITSSKNNQKNIIENVKKIYDMSEDKNLYQYIQDVLNGKVSRKSYHRISNLISKKFSDDIVKIVGFSIKGYSNEISPGNIEHIVNEHGEKGRTDQSIGPMPRLRTLAPG